MTLKRFGTAGTALLVTLSVVSCAEPVEDAPGAAAVEAGVLPEGHVPVGSSAATASSARALTVSVLETMNSGGYTYVRFEVDGEDAWMAGPQTEVEVGQELVMNDAMPMQNFTSGSLNRTFDVLYFVGGFETADELAAVASAPPVGGFQAAVSEVLSGGGYSYVLVETEGGPQWLAGPMIEVAEGQTVAWSGGMPMNGFRSSTLERTFDEILFVDRIAVVH